MKRIVCFFLAWILAFSLFGCTGKSERTKSEEIPAMQEKIEAQKEDEKSSEKTERIENEETNNKYETDYLITAEEFSDGLAWISISSLEKFESGCIDKKGNIRFTRPYCWNYPFYGGFAWIWDSENEKWIVTDSEGNTVQQIDSAEEKVANGDGYMCTCQHYEDFSRKYVLYRVYDCSGKLLTEKEYEEEFNSVDYREDGVFSFGNDYMGLSIGDVFDFYASKTNTWISLPYQLCNFAIGENQSWNNFSDGYSVVYADLDTNKWRHEYAWLLLGEDGSTKKLELPIAIYEEVDFQVRVSEGKVIFICYDYDGSKHWQDAKLVFYYDIERDQFYKLIPDEYLKYIYTYDSYRNYEDGYYSDERILEFKNGVVAVNMKGADEKMYVSLFDVHGNILLEPVQCSEPATISCDRMVVKNENGCSVYRTDGSLAYELEQEITNYHNDLSHIVGVAQEDEKWLDLDGNDFLYIQDIIANLSK